MSSSKLTCYGGVGAVTGANFLFETKNKKVLIDCGLLQGVPGSEDINSRNFDYDPLEIDFLFITHAHIDHIGKIPKLVKDGFKGVIYSTPETREISNLMLMDTARITENNALDMGIDPLYRLVDAERAMALWQTIEYHKVEDFGDYIVEIFDAGHILGSGMFKFTFPSGKSILFTGDLGNSPSPILKDTENVPGIDYLLMESVYGDRNHENKTVRDEKFKDILNEAIKRQGTVIIPAFSLERTQVILYELDNLFEGGFLPKIPVFLDSPLATHVTEVYEKVVNLYNQKTQDDIRAGDQVFKFDKLIKIARSKESGEIKNIPGAKIIIAGSGMSNAGRVQNHEIHYLPDPNATILFVGYQSPGTLGRQIVEGNKEVEIKGEAIPVKAHIEQIDGFSGHKDSDHLIEFVSNCGDKIKKVFVAMGEPKSEIFLAQRLRDELDVEAIVPERGKIYELDL
jgi:metallo-beta-lactamase family protein